MIRIFIAIGVSLISFAAGIAGMYFLLPHLLPGNPNDPLAAGRDSVETMLPAERNANRLPSARPTPEVVKPQTVDSVEALKQQFESLRQENERLRKQLEGTPTSQAPAQPRVTPTDLSSQLTKLDTKELKSILSQLDNASLEMLYNGATGRNRARLLQAMPPERAAQLVDKMATGRSPVTKPIATSQTVPAGSPAKAQ